MESFKELLLELNACKDAVEWAGNMPVEDVVAKCHRGDWLLWLAKKVNVDDRKLHLAKGYCAKTVIYLMKDERSKKAVQAAIDYGNGVIDKKQLKSAYAAAGVAVAYAVGVAVAYAAGDAAYAAAADADAARSEILLKTAEICREHISKEIIKEVNNLLYIC